MEIHAYIFIYGKYIIINVNKMQIKFIGKILVDMYTVCLYVLCMNVKAI